MKKKNLVFMAVAVFFVIAFAVVINVKRNNGCDSMTLENIESLTMDQESGSDFLSFRVCSKKKGPDLCTPSRGHRDWAMNVRLNFGVSATTPECPECPDSDFDYED